MRICARPGRRARLSRPTRPMGRALCAAAESSAATTAPSGGAHICARRSARDVPETIGLGRSLRNTRRPGYRATEGGGSYTPAKPSPLKHPPPRALGDDAPGADTRAGACPPASNPVASTHGGAAPSASAAPPLPSRRGRSIPWDVRLPTRAAPPPRECGTTRTPSGTAAGGKTAAPAPTAAYKSAQSHFR